MTLKGNQPGNYQPPSGEPVTQVGQQAAATARANGMILAGEVD